MSAKITFYLKGENENFILDWVDHETSEEIANELSLVYGEGGYDIRNLIDAIKRIINDRQNTEKQNIDEAKRLSNLLTQCTTDVAYNKIAMDLDGALDMIDYARDEIDCYNKLLDKIHLFQVIVANNHEIDGKVADLFYDYY